MLSLFRRRNVLGCGLVAFAPFKKQEANLNWIKLLMAYNASRGTDSCGLYINNEVRKGVGDVRNWMAENRIEYNDKLKDKTILAHMRSASYINGPKTVDEAHPFTFSHEGRILTGIHNGTCENMYTMADKYKVDCNGLIVDSQKLYKIIAETGYDVLNNYTGGAALIWVYNDDPGAVYAFKGASKKNPHQPYLDDERPIYLFHNNDGTYFSSIPESLKALDIDRDIITTTQNSVVRFKDNRGEVIFKADRTEANIPVVIHNHKRNDYGYGPSQGSTFPNDRFYNKYGIDGDWEEDEDVVPKDEFKKNVKIKDPFDLYKEFTYSNVSGHTKYMENILYYLGGRYYIFPSTSAGVFVANPHGIDRSNPATPVDGIEDFLASGFYFTKPLYGVLTTGSRGALTGEESGYLKQYFYKGALIETKQVDKFIGKNQISRLDKLYKSNPFEYLKQLSAYSQYPVTFSYDEAIACVKKYKPSCLIFYFRGKELRGGYNYAPLHTYRRYAIGVKGYICGIITTAIHDTVLNDIIEGEEEFVEFTESSELHIGDNDAVELCQMGQCTVARVKKMNNDAEDDLVMQEEFNGIADATYFIRFAKGHPVNIESFSFEGKDAIRETLENWIAEVNPGMLDENVQTSVDKILQNSIDNTEGLKVWMDKFNRVIFETLLYTRIDDICDEMYAQAEEELIDKEIEDEKKKNADILRRIGENLENDTRLPVLSFKTRDNEEWKEQLKGAYGIRD